jgi:hypothetical protein
MERRVSEQDTRRERFLMRKVGQSLSGGKQEQSACTAETGSFSG